MNEICVNDENHRHLLKSSTASKITLNQLHEDDDEEPSSQPEHHQQQQQQHQSENDDEHYYRRRSTSTASSVSNMTSMSAAADLEPTAAAEPLKLDAFFEKLLATNGTEADSKSNKENLKANDAAKTDMTKKTTTTTGSYFICVCCRVNFESNADFLQHLENEHYFVLDKERERFVRTEMISAEKKLIAFLMEKKMKQKFLAKYAHDLLVGNEETALCLEQLNKETSMKIRKMKTTKLAIKNGKQRGGGGVAENFDENNNNSRNSYDENDENSNGGGGDEDNNEFNSYADYDSVGEDADEETNDDQHDKYSLLFIDYSIIQFNRVIMIVKALYNQQLSWNGDKTCISTNTNIIVEDLNV